MILFIENSRKCKLICSNRREISACLGMGVRQVSGRGKTVLQRATRKLLEVIDIFISLTVMMILWEYMYVGT